MLVPLPLTVLPTSAPRRRHDVSIPIPGVPGNEPDTQDRQQTSSSQRT